VMEIFMAYYSADTFDRYVTLNRMTGSYAPVFWTLIILNILIPQTLWFEKVRNSTVFLFLVAGVINVGMWLERYVIIITSLHRDFLPSSWELYGGTVWDYATLAGTLGLFLSLMYLFIRFLPMISMSEVRHLITKHRPENVE
jgi:hypothetical protein